MKIELFFDGGCSPNPGQKYGSYEVIIDGKQKHLEPRLALGYGTNNEAEFEILIVALKRIANYLERKGVAKNLVDIVMVTDSTIVANRISGKNKRGVAAVKAAVAYADFLGKVQENVSAKKQAERRMAALQLQCTEILDGFKSFEITWKPRDLNVSKFGH